LLIITEFPFLEKKQKLLVVNTTNKNDIIKILGNPSTTSKFDNDVWIYIERKQTQSKLKNLGRMKIYKNDVLVLEVDDYGILKKKNFSTKMTCKILKLLRLQQKWALKEIHLFTTLCLV
jgi:outer membrane protein assembly factor BamE (lipoprotein component of BamABCDE complex)